MHRNQIIALSLFFCLAAICAILAVISDLVLGPSIGSKLSDVSIEGLKLTFAALLGALSSIMGKAK
jgi:hypothetical protein